MKKVTAIPAKPTADSWVEGQKPVASAKNPEVRATPPVAKKPAKPRPEKPSKEKENDEPIYRLSFDMSRDLYRKFRKYCFENELKMATVTRDLVEKFLKNK